MTRGLDRYISAALRGEVSVLAHRFHGHLLRIPGIMALAMLPLATTADAQGRGRDRKDVARAQGVPSEPASS